MRNYKIAVAGTGYVGLSLGVLLSQHHQVVAVDIVQAKVDMMKYLLLYLEETYGLTNEKKIDNAIGIVANGCANNLPKPRIINGRESVLDKLRIRQMAREKQKSGQMQEQSTDIERNRK